MMCGDSKCGDDDPRNKPSMKQRMELTKKPTRKRKKKPTMKPTMMQTMKPTMKPCANREAHSGKCKNYKEDRDYQKEVHSWCFCVFDDPVDKDLIQAASVPAAELLTLLVMNSEHV
jgi:hypothetical protein